MNNRKFAQRRWTKLAKSLVMVLVFVGVMGTLGNEVQPAFAKPNAAPTQIITGSPTLVFPINRSLPRGSITFRWRKLNNAYAYRIVIYNYSTWGPWQPVLAETHAVVASGEHATACLHHKSFDATIISQQRLFPGHVRPPASRASTSTVTVGRQ